MANIKVATAAPSGLSIDRNRTAFNLSWKITAKDYGAGQQLQYRWSTQKKWHHLGKKSSKIGKKVTQRTVRLDTDDFFPNKKSKVLSYLEFRVRGKRSIYDKGTGKDKKTYEPEWSAWSTKRMNIYPPLKPDASVSMSDTVLNEATFTWKVSTSKDGGRPFYNVIWESILVEECSTTDPDKIKFDANAASYQSGTGDAEGSVTIREETGLLANNASYTRWFRVRSQGAGGQSEWRSAYHVYALPYAAVINAEKTKATATEADGLACQVYWNVSQPKARPIDKITVQYALASPDPGMKCPDGASWQNAVVVAHQGAEDAARFSIDDTIGFDKCLFVRVNTEHDARNDTGVTYGVPVLVTNGVGLLSDPTNVSVQSEESTHRVVVTATNVAGQNIADSYLAVYYMTESDPQPVVVGIIPNGASQSDPLQCPDWTGKGNVGFGVQAFVGPYTVTVKDGVSIYSIDSVMSSGSIIWRGGAVPVAPAKVTVAPTETPGTVRVSWQWSWPEANSAELSWSDHKDAWESTDEPSSYIISKINAAAWNITGLDAGTTWYIRVRLLSGTDDDVTAGPWSEPVAVDLSSAPVIPVLNLSESVIAPDGTVTATWAYTTTDGTMQAFAEICEATIASTGITYSAPIATTDTAQSITLDAKELGWAAGSTHLLCVRVVSASGRRSDNWSAPVPVTVAEPLTCSITDTSLTEQEEAINPQTYSGDIVSFEADFAQPITELIASMEPIQELNGYTHPWVGGAGKNLCPPFVPTSGTGLTVTANSDGSLSVSGTATASGYITEFATLAQTIPSGTAFVISIKNAVSVRIRAFFDNGVADIYAGNTSSASITQSDDVAKVRLYLFLTAGTAYNFTIYLQLEKGSAATAWEPYENICPISGWDGVSVTRAGKNLLPPVFSNGYYDINNGEFVSSSNWKALEKIKCTPSTTYTLSGSSYGVGGTNGNFVYWDENNRYLTNGGTGSTITTPERACWMAFYIGSRYFTETMQLELGTTATDYEPYTGETITQEFVDAQGNTLTVYGGESEIVGGVLTVNYVQLTDDLASRSWYDWLSANNERVFYAYVNGTQLAQANPSTMMICNKYKSMPSVPANAGAVLNGNGTICYRSAPNYDRIYVRDDNYNTVEEFKASLSDLQVVYELATPITYTLTPQQVVSLIGTNNIWADTGPITLTTMEDHDTINALTQMPLEVTVQGAGVGGITTVALQRAKDYHMARPNESRYNGFAGETVAVVKQTGETPITFDVDDLIGPLDDGTMYNIVATVQDALGQSAKAELTFKVNWAHKALLPIAAASIDAASLIAMITPTAPEGALPGDTFDIYRLSVDKPELIVEGGTWGTVYVDPYPAIGEHGGHRIVYRTFNGDYITEDQQPAWVDLDGDDGDQLDIGSSVIDFNGIQIPFAYNQAVSTQHQKSFQETLYLGGSVEGDWNLAVSRKGTLKATVLALRDPLIVEALRRLATWPGICHVRTKDGASYAANVDVNDDIGSDTAGKEMAVSLSITRVGPQGFDGMTLEQWLDDTE